MHKERLRNICDFNPGFTNGTDALRVACLS